MDDILLHMGWKCSMFHFKLGGAIVLKRCQDGFTDKIMETCKSTYVTVNCSKRCVVPF